MDEDSFAYDAFNGKGDHPADSLVPVSAWMKSYSSRFDDVEFLESTLFLEFYNATLTLLWQP